MQSRYSTELIHSQRARRASGAEPFYFVLVFVLALYFAVCVAVLVLYFVAFALEGACLGSEHQNDIFLGPDGSADLPIHPQRWGTSPLPFQPAYAFNIV